MREIIFLTHKATRNDNGRSQKMLNDTDNEFLTRVGPGTPMGDYLRRFCMPFLLPEELEAAFELSLIHI